MQISIDAAARDFRALIEAVRNGEEVTIEDGAPVVLMEIATRSGFRFGLPAGILEGPLPEFTGPVGEDELASWEGRDEEAR